jgi:hypothetical protein
MRIGICAPIQSYYFKEFMLRIMGLKFGAFILSPEVLSVVKLMLD